MNSNLIERGCADCLLRAMQGMREPRPEAGLPCPDPENAPERQLEQLERSFGPNWKW
jgi:hypothetical protein